MKKVNVVNRNANLNLLIGVPNDLEQVEEEYKGNLSPCVVFEDNTGEVYFVANSKKEYLLNSHLLPPSLEEKKMHLLADVDLKIDSLIEYLNKKYNKSKELGTIEDIKSELDFWKVNQSEYFSLSESDRSSYALLHYPANTIYARIKKRTFEEQMKEAIYKRELTHLASATTEDLKGKILSVANEAEYLIIKKTVDFISSLTSVKDFMRVVANQ